MKKFLVFISTIVCCIGIANAAVRDGTAISRTQNDKKQTQIRTATTPRRTTAARPQRVLSSRSAMTPSTRNNTTDTARNASSARVARATSNRVISRAASQTGGAISETRTGAEYEQCKNTYFSCMDQFCTLKNDAYRRCSCNDRVFELDAARKTLESAGEQLTAFKENLQVVGMTAEQATAIRTSSEGEDALTADKSASKALLQAIMNSIRGEDTNVAGKYSPLNSINLSFDTSGNFDSLTSGQAIAAYNGLALYNAVYPQCRNAVRADCNDASLQRAITAYLMAIEQDCNTVQSAIENTKQQVKSAIREGDAMLDLARVENRQKHNSSDVPTCINEVESAILSEEVCGKNYHKCLDNGEYIDIKTGAPIAGIKDFFKLEQLLYFTPGVEAVHQKLAQNPSNRTFVERFVNRTKKFAEPALDKCVEQADLVWSEYLDRAMLAIYYAQKEKVSEIKQNCFSYISDCYMNNDSAIAGATDALSSDKKVVLTPDKIALNSQMCSDYIESCNNMFDNNIINEYIATRDKSDTLTACRAVVKQCFDKFGGPNYENFVNPNSGLFEHGRAIDWFTLYHHYYDTGESTLKKAEGYVSQCAQQLTKIDTCNTPEIIEKAFGGMDSFITIGFRDNDIYTAGDPNTNYDQCSDEIGTTNTDFGDYYECINALPSYNYGLLNPNKGTTIFSRDRRPTGVATEVYNQIISLLDTQCTSKQGKFLQKQSADFYEAIPYKMDVCAYTRTRTGTTSTHYVQWLENICPAKYQESVDTASWGMCSCWHNGGRRSRWGTTETCLPILPVVYATYDPEKILPSIRPPVQNTDSSDLFARDNNQNHIPNYDIKINDAPCSTILFAPNPNGTFSIDTTYDSIATRTSDTILTVPNSARTIPEVAVLYGGWGQGKLTEYWCTQDQISIHGQVCSYTGLNSDGECNPVPGYENDQNTNEIIETATITPSGVSSNK
ncbi:MAG: hypothetical protein IJE79_00500 [Alphaproteobacteria bacterium]|nr:hypothetical protein [Alphaproteobacteria bacterium]